MRGNRGRSVFLLMGYAALGHFNRIAITVAGDEVFIPKHGISEVEMGWVYTAFLIVYTIGMLPGGWLIDRWGSARVLTLFGLGLGTFVVLTGSLGGLTSTAAALLIGSLWGGVTSTAAVLLIGLLVVRSLAGAFNAPLHPGAAHVVSDVIPGSRRASANGMITAGALIGIACCYPIFGWLIDHLKWPWAFVVSGAALMTYGLLWRLLATPALPIAKPQTPATGQRDSQAVWALLRQRDLWLITLSYAAYGYFQYLFFYWMGYYFKEVLDVPNVDARWAQFWIMLAQGAGMAIGGLGTDVVCRWLGTTHGRRVIVMTGMGLGAAFGVLAVNVDGLFNVARCLAISMAATGMGHIVLTPLLRFKASSAGAAAREA
ncbi:MAG: MFS transporter, partial [Planctomycetaceae bacterium]